MTPDPRAQAADRLECLLAMHPGDLSPRRYHEATGSYTAADAIREAVAVLRDPGCVGRGVERVRGDGA